MKMDSADKKRTQAINALFKKYEPVIKSIAAQVQRRPLGEYERGLSWDFLNDPKTLIGKSASDLLDCAGDLSREPLMTSRFGPNYLENKIRVVVNEILKDEAAGIALLKQIITELLVYSKTERVLLRVSGLVLERPNIAVGHVTFHRADDQWIDDMAMQMARLLVGHPGHAATSEMLDGERNSLVQHLGNGTVADCQILAEPDRAVELALDEVRRAIEVLSFSWAATFGYSDSADAVPRANVIPSDRFPVAVLIGEESSSWISDSSLRSGPIFVNSETYAHMDGNGLGELSGLLAKANPSLFEQAILRAVHWVGASQTQEDDQNRLLNLITALETLLSPDDRERIGRSIGEGLALLIRPDIRVRTELRKWIETQYGHRSNTTHGSRRAVETTDLRQLRLIVIEAVQQALRLRSSFGDPVEFRNWINQAKLESLRILPDARNSLANLRRLRSMEQGDLAERLGVSADDVHRWESKEPTFEELDRLAEFFQIDKGEIDFPGRIVFKTIDGREVFIRLSETSLGFYRAEVASQRVIGHPSFIWPPRTRGDRTREVALLKIETAIHNAIRDAERESEAEASTERDPTSQ